jgi:alanine racemase
MLYQTHAVIHLGNIRHNVEGIRARVGTGRKVLLAVKANAYGHGAVQVARMAEATGVEWLGVATVPEAMELRAAGITLPVLKFSPAFPEEMDAAVANGVTLAVVEKENLEALQQAARRAGRQVDVHLKVDTGMGRIGVSMGEAAALARWVKESCPHLCLQGVMTHLPVSDDPSGDAFTRRQLGAFRRVVEEVEGAVGHAVPLVHAANSGGILAHDDSWLSLVRPGIMLYGLYPGGDTPRTVELRPGMSLLTRVSFIKRVTAGTPIGYGGTWKAPEDSFIATIPAGYADGFNRLFSNRGRVLVHGRSYPIVGRVCMDQSMVNLGPTTACQVGDRVTLLGTDGREEITADEWASKLGTISYEVTCQVNARVSRVHEPW